MKTFLRLFPLLALRRRPSFAHLNRSAEALEPEAMADANREGRKLK